MALSRASRTVLFTFAILFAMVFSLLEWQEEGRIFQVQRTLFSASGEAGWQENGFDDTGWGGVRLPFFREDGYFRTHFTTTKANPTVTALVEKCVLEAYLNGVMVYGLPEGSNVSACDDWSGRALALEGAKPGDNVLALRLLTSRDENGELGTFSFYLDDGTNKDAWLLGAIAAALLAAFAAIWAFAGLKGVMAKSREHLRGLFSDYEFVFIIILAILLRMLVSNMGLSSDLKMFTLDAENLISGGRLYNLTKDFASGPYDLFDKTPLFIMLLALIRQIFEYSTFYRFFLTKLPTILCDLGVGYLVYDHLKKGGTPRFIRLAAMSLWLLNPLVIMTGALMGKYDSIVLMFLLLAMRNTGNRRFSLYFALAALTKQNALFLLPWLLYDKKTRNRTILAVALVAIVLTPFLMQDAGNMAQRMFQRHATKAVGYFSWMTSLYDTGLSDQMGLISQAVFYLYLAVLLALPLLRRVPMHQAASITFTLFLLAFPIPYEHYLVWCLPFLLLTAFEGASVLSFVTYLLLSFSGMIVVINGFSILTALDRIIAYLLVILFYDLYLKGLKPKDAPIESFLVRLRRH